VLAYFAVNFHLGYGLPMAAGTIVAAVSVVIALLLSPETMGQELTADLVVVGADD
jgi:SHS family lactate transporter-like MFS transporter